MEGIFYAIIDAKSVDLELVPENASTIIDKAIHIRNTINEKFEITHPEYSFIRGLTHVEFYTDPTHECAHVKKYSCCTTRRNRSISMRYRNICEASCIIRSERNRNW